MADPVPPPDPDSRPDPPAHGEPAPPPGPAPSYRRGEKHETGEQEDGWSPLGVLGAVVGVGLILFQIFSAVNRQNPAPPKIALPNLNQPRAARLVTFRVWDARTGAVVAEPPIPGATPSIILDATFGPDGKTLLGAGTDKCLFLWDLDRPGEPVRFGGFSDTSADVAVSDDLKRVAGADLKGRVRVWDVANPAAPVHTFSLPDDGPWVPKVGFHGKTAEVMWASASTGLTRYWKLDGPDPKPMFEFDRLKAFDARDGHVVFAPAAPGSAAEVWDVAAGKRIASVAPPRGTAFTGLRFGPTPHRLVAALDDGTVRVFDAPGGAELFPIDGFNPEKGVRLGSGDDGKRVYAVGRGKVSAWDPVSGGHVGDYPLEPGERVLSVRRVGPLLVGAKSDDGEAGVVVWEVPVSGVGDGRRLWASTEEVRFSRNGNVALRGKQLVDPATGRPVAEPAQVGNAAEFLCAAFDRDGKVFAGTPALK